jgi:hypothetical protein
MTGGAVSDVPRVETNGISESTAAVSREVSSF